jgi:antitoxin component YwqK of YwqJK toxin-antitoxin module
LSNGCFLLNKGGEWVKHGVWVFYNQETKLIDSINFENGKMVGVRKIFNSKGRLLTLIEYQNKEYPRNVRETQFCNNGASRKIIINYIQFKNDSSFKHGPSIYIRKNGNLIDPLYYENGIIKYRTRFYPNGNISSTTDYGDNPKPGSTIHVIVYKIDGKIRSKRIEIVGKRGYNLD